MEEITRRVNSWAQKKVTRREMTGPVRDKLTLVMDKVKGIFDDVRTNACRQVGYLEGATAGATTAVRQLANVLTDAIHGKIAPGVLKQEHSSVSERTDDSLRRKRKHPGIVPLGVTKRDQLVLFVKAVSKDEVSQEELEGIVTTAVQPETMGLGNISRTRVPSGGVRIVVRSKEDVTVISRALQDDVRLTVSEQKPPQESVLIR